MGLEVILNNDALLNALNTKSNEVPDKLQGLGIDASDILVKNSQNEAPIIIGNLASSIYPDGYGDLSWIVAPDENVAPYALFVILGTAPHEIKGNPWLFWPGASHPVRSVMHPGNKPNDFLQRGLDLSQDDIDAKVQEFEAWCKDIEG